MTRPVIFFCALVLVAGSAWAQSTRGGADWPRFLGANADGISTETGINKDWGNRPPKVVWEVAMHDRGHAGPAVAGGKVFIIDHQGEDDVVRAIDLATGKDLWTFRYPDVEKPDHGYARSTPLVEGGRVYAVGRYGPVHCLDADTGALIWFRDIVKDFSGKPPTWQLAMSPIVDGEKLIVCPGGPGASVVALDKKTGQTIWQGGGTYKLGYATPVIATLLGKKQYLVFMGSHLVSVDPETGKELWNYPWPAIQSTAMPLVVGEDSVFITAWYERKAGTLLKVDGSGSVRPVWENQHIMAKMNTPALVEAHLYGNNSATGSLVCVEARTGELRWQQKGFEQGGSVAVDGVLLAVDGRSGQMAMVELTPAGYRELGRISPFEPKGGSWMRGNVWAPPIVAQGKAILRDRNSLVCIDLR